MSQEDREWFQKMEEHINFLHTLDSPCRRDTYVAEPEAEWQNKPNPAPSVITPAKLGSSTKNKSAPSAAAESKSPAPPNVSK